MADFDNTILVEDEEGQSKEFAVEALFDMDEDWYALLKSGDERLLMRVINTEEDEQYLVGIDDPKEAEAILDAYQIALEADANTENKES